MSERAKAAAIVRKVIRAQRPEDWWYGSRDAVGHKINVHYDDGGYAATVNYETYPWCDAEVEDDLDYELACSGLPFSIEMLSDYEVGLKAI